MQRIDYICEFTSPIVEVLEEIDSLKLTRQFHVMLAIYPTTKMKKTIKEMLKVFKAKKTSTYNDLYIEANSLQKYVGTITSFQPHTSDSDGDKECKKQAQSLADHYNSGPLPHNMEVTRIQSTLTKIYKTLHMRANSFIPYLLHEKVIKQAYTMEPPEEYNAIRKVVYNSKLVELQMHIESLNILSARIEAITNSKARLEVINSLNTDEDTRNDLIKSLVGDIDLSDSEQAELKNSLNRLQNVIKKL